MAALLDESFEKGGARLAFGSPYSVPASEISGYDKPSPLSKPQVPEVLHFSYEEGAGNPL